MKVQVVFTGKDILIISNEGKEILPPYFYYNKNSIVIGKHVQDSINLYYKYIYNVFLEKEEQLLAFFFKKLEEYLVHNYKVKSYLVEVDPICNHLILPIKKHLPSVVVKESRNISGRILPDELKQHLYNAFSSVIANELIRNGKVRGDLYDRIYGIIFLNIPFYVDELLGIGRSRVTLKVVDPIQSKVIVINEEMTTEIPALKKLTSIYQYRYKNNQEITEALYKLYDGQFKVTFLSPFSYGKSTLINGLIGSKMLNMDIRAETAILTKVVSAPDSRLFVKYANQQVMMYTYENEEQLREMLKDLIGVRSAQAPVEVQIFCKLDHLPGVTIIDAPGLHSRHNDHDEKAFEALKMSDFALFLINPSNIGNANFSAQIREFLQFSKEHNKKFGFILSRLDLHSEDYNVIMKEMEHVLKDLAPWYPLSQVLFISGFFALYGKLLAEGKIDVQDARRNRSLFVIEDEDIIMGRGLEKHHAQSLIDFSSIHRLETFIRERGEYHTNQFDLDCRERETAAVPMLS